MALRGGKIELDNEWNTYYAGQTMHGAVHLYLDQPEPMRRITIRFLGQAITEFHAKKKHFAFQSETNDDITKLTFTGYEKYFEIHDCLMNIESSVLPDGVHSCRFNCPLPDYLPSSFEGRYGFVRYTLRVTLQRPWPYNEHLKMPFTVISPLDLNTIPRVRIPSRLDIEKTIGCFGCCSAGARVLMVNLPVSGYVSGEHMTLACTFLDGNRTGVDFVKFTLRQNATFHSNLPRDKMRRDRVNVVEMTVGPFAKDQQRNWVRHLRVPPLPPSGLLNCGIIDIDYELVVQVIFSRLRRKLKGIIPVIIGTILLSSMREAIAPYNSSADDDDDDDDDDSSSGSDMDLCYRCGLFPNLEDNAPRNADAAAASGGGGSSRRAAPAHAATLSAQNKPLPKPVAVFEKSSFKARTIVDAEDTEHTFYAGDAHDYAPRYPAFCLAGKQHQPPPQEPDDAKEKVIVQEVKEVEEVKEEEGLQ